MAVSSTSQEFNMRGWLLKWTNYVKGYKQRWFVLSNDTLSYYRNQAEMAHTCRGTINLLGAFIHTQDQCTFVVSNGPSQAFYLKANGEIERQRWVTALELAKTKAINTRELLDDVQLPNENDYQSEITNIIKILGYRIENLQTCYTLIEKHGHVLQKTLSEVEKKETPDEILNEIKKINQQATLFRVTSNDMITNCTEYLELVKIKYKKLQQILLEEHNQRKRLNSIVERLVTQYSILEKAAKKKRLLSASEIKTITLPIKTADDSADDENTVIEYFDALDVQATDKDSIAGMFLPTEIHERDLRTSQIITTASEFERLSDQALDAPEVPARHSTIRMSLLDEKSRRKPLKRRTRVPDRPNISVSLWSVMKNSIGKDLSKIPMPVNFSEPLSMLQRLAEDLAYSSILDYAATREDVCEQLAYIAAFTISSYSTTAIRSAKPFNPLLGETFELDRSDDLGWRLISEQVSHHPPMAAQYCESTLWTFWQEFTMSSKFRGKYLQVIPLGIAHLVIHNSGNHYTWRKVTTTVHNIIVGTLWVDQHGEMDITNHTDGSQGQLTFLPFNYFKSENQRRVKGTVFNKEGEAKWTVDGTWDKEVQIAPVLRVKGTKDNPLYDTGDKITAWKNIDPPPESEKYYHFTLFACQLNEIEKGVAPTDSRLRPDQRLMEEGKWDEANSLKVTLEEKQRAVRKAREAAAKGKHVVKQSSKTVVKKTGNDKSDDMSATRELSELIEDDLLTPHKPTWFEQKVDPTTGNIIHVYSGSYWEAKEKQDWTMCPDIYI